MVLLALFNLMFLSILYSSSKRRQKRSAFTVIEILIDVAIIGMVATAVLSLMVMNLRSAAYSQMRIVAANLANDRMEMIRNLPYDDIATEHGPILPQKNLLDSETVNKSGYQFTIVIDARYYDDPFDHLATDPAPDTDVAPIDYKKVKISVFAAGRENPVAELATNIASKAAETPSDTGILLVKVVDNPAKGDLAIGDASVHVTNPALNIDITAATLDSGYAMIPLLPPANNNSYHVSVTKAGFSTDETLAIGTCQSGVAPSPSANLNPNIIVQRVTSITMQIRCLTDLNVTVLGAGGQPVPNTTIRVQSSRLICTDPKSKYDQWLTTDANGVINSLQIEHDTYFYTTAPPPTCPATCPASIVGYSDDYDPALCQTVHSIVNIGDTTTYITISDVTPRHPFSSFTGEFTFYGTNLDKLASAKFVRAGHADVVGEISVLEEDIARVIFNLNGAANGSWDLIVTNTSGETSVWNNAIEIIGN
jgi:type II secretory pathway pseudopilin PulG